MRAKFLLFCLALVLGGGLYACFGMPLAGGENLELQLEQIAQTNRYFSQTVIIDNRLLRLEPVMEENLPGTNRLRISNFGTNPLVAEQLQLQHTLSALSGGRHQLIGLLKSPDPKVRTLALGAIFQREDGRDLPLIASLINDSAQTFPNLHESINQQAGPRPLSEITNSQTVGNVAQAMLAFWGVRLEGVRITTSNFAQYWRKYAGRDYAASWFAVKMKRATRQTTPIQPEYQPDIQRVLAEMEALPMPDRAWIELYVLAPGGWVELEKDDLVQSDDELIGMVKKLGADSLLRFLQRQRISDDPDLCMDKDDPNFNRMSDFILLHADKLLNTNDADAVLACEYVQRDSGGVDPAWPIGAALLQPVRAHKILHDALTHETRTYETAAGELAGALWRVCGPVEIPFLVNWFYTGLPTASEYMHQPVAFLWAVEVAGRPDTKQLMTALVKDPRFDHTDWDTLKELLTIVNANHSTPLVYESDIYGAQRNGLFDERIVLANWRNLLRREYGVPEEPRPAAWAVPEQVVAQPAWSVPIPGQKILGGKWRLAPSPDGQWLALLSHEIVSLWRIDTGKLAWQPPSSQLRADAYPAVAGGVAFTVTGQLLTFDHGDNGRFLSWDLATHLETKNVLLRRSITPKVLFLLCALV